MNFSQIKIQWNLPVIAILALVCECLATGYMSDLSGGRGARAASSGSSKPRSSSYGSSYSDQSGPPQPYKFDYNAADEEGNKHYRNEEGDQNGNVKGTYGYNDVQGLYRIVEYIADQNGFRVNIKTNEPGVDDKESPADVVLTADKPPAGLGGGMSSGRSYRSAGSASSGFSGLSGAGKPSGKSGY